MRPDLPTAITEVRVIAILRGLRSRQAIDVARSLADAGVRAIEVTIDSPSAGEVIAEIAELDGVIAGAGTILTIADAELAVAAGAAFLIAPVVDASVIGWAAERGIPAIPGAMTPTEAQVAWVAGAAGVKLFPAGPLGPHMVSAIRAPLPHIPLIPTGGVNRTNALAFLEAGAVAVALGADLTAGGDSSSAGRVARALLASIS